MSRRHSAEKRLVLPDAKFGDVVLTKFMNSLMFHGKKSTAETIVYGALKRVEDKLKKSSVELFHEALENIKPSIEVRSRRVGGATYQVPVEVTSSRKNSLAIRWILTAARKREGKSMALKLASEILDAKDNKGGAAKKREDTLKMAEANRAFSHYRW